jgi:hypothetical protein
MDRGQGTSPCGAQIDARGAGALALAWLTALGAPASADVETLVMHQKLVGSDAAPDRLLGSSVGLSGDVAVTGSFLQQEPGTAHVFRRDGASWTEEQILTASDGAPSDLFGRAVAVSGDLVIVGAPWDQDSGFASGSAYAFRHDGTSWTQERKLVVSDITNWDRTGWAVALAGGRAFLGAPKRAPCAVYAFELQGSSWVETQILEASPSPAGTSASTSRSTASAR